MNLATHSKKGFLDQNKIYELRTLANKFQEIKSKKIHNK